MRKLLFALMTVACVATASAQTEPAKPAATETKPAAATNAAAKPKPVKKPVGGAAIFKENGKTCSGQDQYKVCW